MVRMGVLGAVVCIACMCAPASATAGLVIDYNEVGSDVVAIGSGTANLAGLTYLASGSVPGGVSPSSGYAYVGGSGPPPPHDRFDRYGDISGPSSFGTGGLTHASSNSGDLFGLFISRNYLYVPQGYVSGAAIYGTSTFSGRTFATLGLEAGTYVSTWGTGQTADSLTMNIGVQPIPEPTTLALFGIGLAGLVAWRRKRRKT